LAQRFENLIPFRKVCERRESTERTELAAFEQSLITTGYEVP
jgi:hypothetical protein